MGSCVATWRPKARALLAALLVAVAAPAPAELAFAGTAASTDSQAMSLTGYARSSFRPQAMPDAALPYHDTPLAPRVDPGLHDEQGVRMFRYHDEIYDHPVAQAQWGLSNLRTYLVNHDRSYLDRAVAQAQRNLDRRVESRGAWWYPYGFDVPACGQPPVVPAPWYSAMSQGQLLSLFVRLHQVTGDQKWREAADLTFASLLLPPGPGLPWVSWIDDAGYLWLEEYPVTPGVTGERVLNGHIFALYGVYDYWRLAADPRAVAIFDGAATSLRHYVPTALRMPEWVSRYAVGCPNAYLGYHALHIQQLLKLYEMSRAAVFAGLADLLRDDYPPPTVTGTVVFAGGTHVGYTFSSTGSILAQKPLTLSRQSNANADQRIRVRGRGVYYRIQNGALAGYLVAEEPGTRVLRGAVAPHTYAPQRTLLFSPGTYPGHRYGPAWTVAESRTHTFVRASAAPFDATAWVNGRLCYRITAGAYAGLWLPAVEGLNPA